MKALDDYTYEELFSESAKPKTKGHPPLKPVVIITPTGGERFFPSISEAARVLEVDKDNLRKTAVGKYKQCCGYIARYV
jgi:hypothetical protein